MFESEWFQYVFIALIFLLLIWNLTRRRRQSTGNPNMDAAGAVLSDINQNLRVADERLANYQSKKKFYTGSWSNYKDKLGFLGTELSSDLNKSFLMAEDFNMRIDSAKRSNAMSVLQDMPVESLKEQLTRNKEALVSWLKTNYQLDQMNNPPRRGCGA
ncbi:MAG: hypothetical protein PHU23_06340 [Dehalococcoidales bacterium]|nr:hypothetical protein [Dehalococcoidales bacterium]